MGNQGEAYQFSAVHYRLAMDAADIGMWDWDLLHDTQIWNDRCRTIFDYAPGEQASYRRFLQLVHPDDRAAVERRFRECLLQNKEYRAEYRIIVRDGSVRWIAVRGRAMYDHLGRPVRMIGVVFDVTARKDAEEKQQWAEKRVQDVMESVEEALTHLDSEWRFTYVNTRATCIGGYIPREDLLGRKIWDVYPQLMSTPTYTYFHQVMETRQPVAYEIYYDDIQSWYDVRAYPADDGGITILLTDITERKALEQERDRLFEQEQAARKEAESARRQSDKLVERLERKRAFLQGIMHQVPCGLMIAEAPHGNITLFSEEASTILGHTCVECDHYTEYDRFNGLHADGSRYQAEEYPLARALLKGEVIRQEDMFYQTPSGAVAHLVTNAAPIRDARGNTVAAVITFNDASERYELERKKDEFISMASHELRTPLTSIKGNLQLARRRLQHFFEENRDKLSREDAQLFENLAQWNERALRQINIESRLINDLLDASRIQSEQLRVVLEPGNLVQIVSEAVNDVQASEEGREISLELPEQPEIPVMADSVRIGQVVTNYLSNALKYSPADKPIKVGLRQMGDNAYVWVKDAGPGIAPEALEYIWDRFRQVGSFVDYTRQTGGLGLGLYINQALVQLHGGRSGVESTTGKGSTFWFTLPLAMR